MQKTFPHPFHFSVVFRKKIIENYKKILNLSLLKIFHSIAIKQES